MLIMRAIAMSCLLLAAIGTCACAGPEKEFFRGDLATRVERLAAYPLAQQWEIFRYGNQVRHPPDTGLAIPIARRGKPALDFVLHELQIGASDLDYRDSMVVFQTMQWGRHYDICADEVALKRIQANAALIRSPDWRKVYEEMLQNLCRHANRN
jgi:hypothetical protein